MISLVDIVALGWFYRGILWFAWSASFFFRYCSVKAVEESLSRSVVSCRSSWYSVSCWFPVHSVSCCLALICLNRHVVLVPGAHALLFFYAKDPVFFRVSMSVSTGVLARLSSQEPPTPYLGDCRLHNQSLLIWLNFCILLIVYY